MRDRRIEEENDMIDNNHMTNKTVLQEQYKNTENLKLRKSLHEKYSINKIGFQKWMFEQYPFRPKMKVLDAECVLSCEYQEAYLCGTE